MKSLNQKKEAELFLDSLGNKEPV